MNGTESIVIQQGKLAKAASKRLAMLTTSVKNNALLAIASALIEKQDQILKANAVDIEQAKANGRPQHYLDRLMLSPKRINDMAAGLKVLVTLEDPVGRVEGMWKGAQEIEIGQVRVPLGVVGIIYEARPNVTVDAAGICLKTGNAILLRGSREALHSNQALVDVMVEATLPLGIPEGSIQMIADPSHEAAQEMMQMNRYIDVLMPRGGAGLIRSVVENSTVPVIETGVGNCHIYVDEGADLENAVDIIMNAKTQRPSVCNAMETLLVNENVAADLLPALEERLVAAGVEIRACDKARAYLKNAVAATEEDYATEFLDLILAIRVVPDLDTALDHIDTYGTRHSEAILTNDYYRARRFQKEVDAAAVYVNASTRFTDGFEFGFGAEMGISTQKLHARGPVGLVGMTTIKYIVNGSGQCRE